MPHAPHRADGALPTLRALQVADAEYLERSVRSKRLLRVVTATCMLAFLSSHTATAAPVCRKNGWHLVTLLPSSKLAPAVSDCTLSTQQAVGAPYDPVTVVHEPYLAPGVDQPRSSSGWFRWDLVSPVLVMLGVLVHAILEGLAIGLSVSCSLSVPLTRCK